MFKAVITRDGGEPWPQTEMTSRKWLDVPIREIQISDLIATQDGVYFHALALNADPPIGGDSYPHVISWGGELYLEDGHHRVVRAAIEGRKTIRARLLVL